MGKRGRRKKQKQKVIVISVALTLTVLAGVYVAISFYFSSHFFFRAKINGWRVGGMDLTAAEEKVGDGVEDYLLRSEEHTSELQSQR